MRNQSRCLSGSIAILLVWGMTAAIAPVAAALEYNSIYSDYSATHDITDSIKTKETFSVSVNTPEPSFKVFVPPGASRITLVVYAAQGAAIGLAARGDNPPQCDYHPIVKPSLVDTKPWDYPGAATLEGLRNDDFQTNNLDGQMLVMDGPLSNAPPNGEWIFIRSLPYDLNTFHVLQFVVDVEVSVYNAWYAATVFSNGQPPFTPGPTGGYCEASWADNSDGAGGGQIDLVPPAASVTAPIQGQTVSGTYTFRASASDNVAVERVSFYLDGIEFQTDMTAPYQADYDTTLLANGTHAVSVKARDTAGNIQWSNAVSFTVDNQSVEAPQTFWAKEFEAAAGYPVAVEAVGADLVQLAPRIAFEVPMSGTYDLLVGVALEGQIYLAEQKPAGVEFYPLESGIRYFRTQTFSGDTTWEVDAFDDWPAVDVDLLRQLGVAFVFIGVPQSGSGPMPGVIWMYSTE